MNSEEYAQQLQEKFELYLLALIFTILGLAVQTAKPGTNSIADILEIFSWLALLCSGVVGLSRLEWIPVAHKYYAKATSIQNELQELTSQKNSGITHIEVIGQKTSISIFEAITDRLKDLKILSEEKEKIEKSTLKKYTLHKRLFITGLIFLICARAYLTTINLFISYILPLF